MDILGTIESAGRSALSAVEHGAAWLVGHAAFIESSLYALEANSPLVGSAVAAGEAFALAHGIPVVAIEDAGAAVLGAAKALADSLTKTGASAAPPAASPPAAPAP